MQAVSFFQNPKKKKKMEDASVILQETKVECKALLAKLNNIVTSEEQMHKVLNDGLSQEFELFPDCNLQLKIKLKDRMLPLSVQFLLQNEKRKDLYVYWSTEHKQPKEHLNHGHQHNVSNC